MKYKGKNNWSKNIYVKLTHIMCPQVTDYPNDAIHIRGTYNVGLVVSDPNAGLPAHQTAFPSAFFSGNTMHYYISRENTENS